MGVVIPFKPKTKNLNENSKKKDSIEEQMKFDDYRKRIQYYNYLKHLKTLQAQHNERVRKMYSKKNGRME